MVVQVENEYLVATFDQLGAELSSLRSKRTNVEYIWQGDPKHWGRHAPVLFPIVGRLQNDSYTYNGSSYQMNQHGFARDCLFEVLMLEEECVSFSLKSSPATKRHYPFDFQLIISYQLLATQLLVTYQVENIGKEKLFFSIGGHPAFNIPLDKNMRFEEYVLKIEPQKKRYRIPLVGPFSAIHRKKILAASRLQFSRDLFEQDAIIFETQGSNCFRIQAENSPYSISLSCAEVPYIGIWSPYTSEAPFVCIEPWWGIADDIDGQGDLKDKIGINQLNAAERFNRNYSITITEH